MQVVPAVAVERGSRRCAEIRSVPLAPATRTPPEPREVFAGTRLLGLSPPVLVPLDVGLPSEDSGTGAPALPQVGAHEGADVQADAVVEVRVPADGLGVERLPADKDTARRLAFKDAP